jgi:surface polysaccharide O-acyltransferase-like enzyme
MPPTTAPAPPPAAPAAAPAATEALTIGGLVDRTPASRDRYVDLLRALSIAVVVLWHWVFSITQWRSDGSLAMPNPIDAIPGAWALTWLLQIMPVFFFVGGYANLAGWESIEGRTPHGWAASKAFITARLRRLVKPVAVFVGCWAVGDTLARLTLDGYRGVLQWGVVVFVPLWFLGVYVGVVLLAPLTIRLHRRYGSYVPALLLTAIVVCDMVRFRYDLDAAGLLTSALVWVFVHQLGYFWRDGTLVRAGRRAHVALVAAGLFALVGLTTVGPYPRSMVSVRGEAVSNMFPTTACIAALAVLQLGVVLLAAPAARRWLEDRRVWSAVVGANAVAMTVFCWHMTALVAAIALYERLGFDLGRDADATWWAQRPLWLLVPGVLLAALVAVFARIELPGRGTVAPPKATRGAA